MFSLWFYQNIKINYWDYFAYTISTLFWAQILVKWFAGNKSLMIKLIDYKVDDIFQNCFPTARGSVLRSNLKRLSIWKQGIFHTFIYSETISKLILITFDDRNQTHTQTDKHSIGFLTIFLLFEKLRMEYKIKPVFFI